MKKLSGFTLPFFILTCGGLIYLCWRPQSIVMFHWIAAIGLTDALQALRGAAIAGRLMVPDIVIYSVPGGLWLFSLLWLNNCVLASTPRLALFVGTLVSGTALAMELGQGLGVVPGTFDWSDLLCLALASLLLAFPARRANCRTLTVSTPKALALGGVIVIYGLLAGGSVDTKSSAETSKAICQITNINGEPDAQVIDGEMDAGVMVRFTVTNIGERGTIKVETRLSTSEGQWSKKQSLVFDAGESMNLEYFFHQPTINAANIQYSSRCAPRPTSD